MAWVLVAAIAGGLVAAVAGFGIGSFLTPLLAVAFGTQLAVALVGTPHFVATALRTWTMREHIDWKALKGFGLMSACGGFAGAALQSQMQSRALGWLLGALLVFVGVSGLTGLAQRMRFEGPTAWIAGGVSGLLGGMVGNQGGIRSGAMLGLGVSKEAFVATATAIGLLVDLARVPVYYATQGSAILSNWPLVAVATAGALTGTLLGRPVLARIDERSFKRVVSALVLVLGVWMLAQAAGYPRKNS